MKIAFSKGKIKVGLLSTGILAMTLNSAYLSALQPKHVAVPPEHMNEQKLLNAESKGVFSHSTMLPIFAPEAARKSVSVKTSALEINQPIYFDGLSNSPVAFIGPNTDQWQLTLTDPNGRRVIDESGSAQSRIPVTDIHMGSESFKGKKFTMKTPVAGTWQVKFTRQANVKSASTAAGGKKGKPIGYLMFKGDPGYKLYSYLDNNFTTVNNDINIVAYMVESGNDRGNRELMVQKKPLQGTVTKAVAEITTPSKQQISVALSDDGLNGDKIAGDGLFSGRIPTDEVGVYTNQLHLEGIRPDGIRFSRTSTDLYPVAQPSVRFTNASASLKSNGNGSAVISVPVEQLTENASVFMAAEVWGTNPKGQPQSATWIGGVVSPSITMRGTTLDLTLDSRWLKRNNLRAPYSLKALRLQTVDNNVPLAELANLPINGSSQITSISVDSLSANAMSSESQAKSDSITREMLMGIAPVSTDRTIIAAGTGSKLLLVHGYCSGHVWNTSSFSNSAEFKDFDQNRSHENFAIQIFNFGSAYASYGIVAHSQGGAAAVHLYSRYWSGLDNATGGRLIQSVGTPYQGTSLAGNLAVLGEVFGAGCGSNTDLTYSGAANWLSTIPSWARAEVDYYTTSFDTSFWTYDYCHLATDLLLDDPEDGTTEKWSGQLSGAVNKGHKKGWCHTTGMRDPAQYQDGSRNASMSSRAAR